MKGKDLYVTIKKQQQQKQNSKLPPRDILASESDNFLNVREE